MTAKNFRIKNGLDIGDVANVITVTGGTATFTGTVASEGSQLGNVTVGASTDNTVTTVSGDLIVDSFTGIVSVPDQLSVTNALNVNTIGVLDSTAIDINSDVRVSGSLSAGGISITNGGIISDSTGMTFNGARLQEVGTPVEPTDASTKGYVDDNTVQYINDLLNVDAQSADIQDGDILVAPVTDSSTAFGFTLASQITAGMRVPAGTTAQRPAIYEGMLRLNSETNKYEGSIDGNTVQEFLVSEIISNTDVDSAVEQVDSFSATIYRAAKYFYTIENSGAGEYQAGEIIVTHDGTTAYHSEYAKIHTGNNDLITFTTGLSGGSVILYGSAQTPNSVFKAKRISMEVA